VSSASWQIFKLPVVLFRLISIPFICSIKTQVIPTKYVKIAKNQIQNLQIENKEVYKILLESQLKEKPIAYTKWEKCLKKDRMHTLTCIKQTLFFTFN
jgi:hypothetical protein